MHRVLRDTTGRLLAFVPTSSVLCCAATLCDDVRTLGYLTFGFFRVFGPIRLSSAAIYVMHNSRTILYPQFEKIISSLSDGSSRARKKMTMGTMKKMIHGKTLVSTITCRITCC
jgi:hypothetical protein